MHWEYLLNNKVVILQTKFKANIARNRTLGPHVYPIWIKNGKKLVIFKNFTLVSQSLSHKIDNSIISVFLTKILFKEFLTWAFWGQDVDPGWVKNS